MAKLGERPAECNDTSSPPLTYRINKIFAKCHGFLFPRGLKYSALDSKASIQEVLSSAKSFIRFGDAEAKLMLGGDWPTQLGSQELAAGLREIFRSYSPESHYLIGVANSRLTRHIKELKRLNIHRTWRNARYVLRRYLQRKDNLLFLEANLFRVGADGIQRQRVERLWQDRSTIILVHNHEKYLHWFKKNYPSVNSFFIQIPEKNFFDRIEDTQHDILELIQKQQLERTEFAVLISAGAGGKVLNYNLCQKDADYLCYDMGNFFHMQVNRKAVMTELEKRQLKRPL